MSRSNAPRLGVPTGLSHRSREYSCRSDVQFNLPASGRSSCVIIIIIMFSVTLMEDPVQDFPSKSSSVSTSPARHRHRENRFPEWERRIRNKTGLDASRESKQTISRNGRGQLRPEFQRYREASHHRRGFPCLTLRGSSAANHLRFL